MYVTTPPQPELSNLITSLTKQKEELMVNYHAALAKGEKLHEVKTLYISLKDADKKLSDLLRINISL